MSKKQSEITIRLIGPDTLDACTAIAATAPDPWRRENLEKTIGREDHPTFVAQDEQGEVLGFAAFFCIGDSADLELIAVSPGARRKGVAQALLNHALPLIAEKGVTRVLLEVRASNWNAIGLYRKLEFKTLARRPDLFAHPKEDGFLMARNIPD